MKYLTKQKTPPKKALLINDNKWLNQLINIQSLIFDDESNSSPTNIPRITWDYSVESMFIHSRWNHFKVCFGTQGVELWLNKRANGSADGNPPWNFLDLDILLDLGGADRRSLTPAAINIHDNIWAAQRWAQPMMGSHHPSGLRMPLNHTRISCSHLFLLFPFSLCCCY